MRIVVNGESMEVGEGLTLTGLLEQLGVRTEHTAVALNREVARRGSYATTVLHDGDRVEIVRPMAGGCEGLVDQGPEEDGHDDG